MVRKTHREHKVTEDTKRNLPRLPGRVIFDKSEAEMRSLSGYAKDREIPTDRQVYHPHHIVAGAAQWNMKTYTEDYVIKGGKHINLIQRWVLLAL